MPKNTDIVNHWLKACTSKWQLKFSPGFVITFDETMWSWSGLRGDLHLTYLPRKPKPLGWMLKTTCCAITGVYINSKLTMKKERMDMLPWVSEVAATTTCTLRLVEPWFNTRRIVVGDSWFGSVRTCLELMQRGMYSVLAVKTGHKLYPKKALLDNVKERFSFACMSMIFSVGTTCVNWIVLDGQEGDACGCIMHGRQSYTPCGVSPV